MQSATAKALALASLMQRCHGIPDGTTRVLFNIPESGIKRRNVVKDRLWRPGERSLWETDGGPEVELYYIYWRWRDRFSDRHRWYADKHFATEVEKFKRGEDGPIAELSRLFGDA